MLGAIAGDIIGSVHEWKPLREDWASFPLFTAQNHFTDDTVMTVAIANALQKGADNAELRNEIIDSMHEYGSRWPRAGYGGNFGKWLRNRDRQPYNSFGNGSAMRVSPVGWVAKTLEEAEYLAGCSADVTHNHPEGIKGAQAVAGAIWLARTGSSKDDIRKYVTSRYNYDLSRRVKEIRENYKFDVTCQGSVPEAISAFLESSNFEEAVRKAVWLGGDADTQAAIAGSIAEAFYGVVPENIAVKTLEYLDDKLRSDYWTWMEWLENK